MTTGWTTLADVLARLRQRFERGEFLTAWARDEPFAPLGVPLRGPSTADLAGRFDEARQWVAGWSAVHVPGVHIRTRSAGHRTIGANALPSRVEVDSYDALWRLLGVAATVDRFAALRAETAVELPDLAGWMNAHPMSVVARAGEWTKLAHTARWVAANPPDGRTFLRQVPVPGVDTKFIEQRRGILAELLDHLLPPERVAAAFPPSQFERRYGFAGKPPFIRLRTLDADRPLLPGVTELSVRTAEFAALAPNASTVYIVENEVTYLAFPPVEDAVVVFGGGFAVSGLAPLPWLAGRRVVYWGDIDTHGFVALDRLRALVPHVESMLMDRGTLLAHAEQWATEPVPATATLTHLTDAEGWLYAELTGNVHGDRLRLEQERITYPAIRAALDLHFDREP